MILVGLFLILSVCSNHFSNVQGPLMLLATLLSLNTFLSLYHSKNEGNSKVSVFWGYTHSPKGVRNEYSHNMEKCSKINLIHPTGVRKKANAIWTEIRHDPSVSLLRGGFPCLLQSCQLLGCHTDNNRETPQYVFI